MKIKDRLDNYLCDREYKIIIKDQEVDIINYDEIVNFTSNQIKVKYHNKLIVIDGSYLVILKMLENEVLIAGNITTVRIN